MCRSPRNSASAPGTPGRAQGRNVSRQLGLNNFADRTEVDQPRIRMLLQRSDHLAHFFFALRTCLLDRLVNERLRASSIERTREIFFEQMNLRVVRGNEIGTPAFFELGFGIGQIFHRFTQCRRDERVIDGLVGVHCGALNRRIGRAQRERRVGIASFHRRDDVGAQGVVDRSHSRKNQCAAATSQAAPKKPPSHEVTLPPPSENAQSSTAITTSGISRRSERFMRGEPIPRLAMDASENAKKSPRKLLRRNPDDMPCTLCYGAAMRMTNASMYARVLASDASYNGRFFFGVTSTGVYCLPACKARKPKPENVRFFPSCEAR